MSIKDERDRQLALQIKADVPAALGIAVGNFKDSFPEAAKKPNGYRGFHDYVLYITAISTLPLDDQMELIGGFNNIIHRVTEDSPSAPYVVWANDGISNQNTTNARSATISEGVLFAMTYPKKVRGQSLDLRGSLIGDDRAAVLVWVEERPKLYDNHLNYAGPGLMTAPHESK